MSQLILSHQALLPSSPVGEVEEPRVVLVRPQGGEPHLPVQARLVRQAEGRGRGQVAWVAIK